jgi:hypothetical protein
MATRTARRSEQTRIIAVVEVVFVSGGAKATWCLLPGDAN